MDSRQHQLPFTRPPERPLIHNPNHQSPPQTARPQAYSAYPPPTSQPQAPVHVPFTDPYSTSRRDPFLPANQQPTRREGYGIRAGDNGPSGERPAVNGGWASSATAHGIHHGHHHAPLSGPPPPPSMSTSHNNPAQPPYGYDGARRRSLGGASPPNPYRASAHDPPPPPPSFPRSHMPPPSSPPQQHNVSQAPSQRTPFPSSFGGGRELPGLGSGHRPGSSMSISSLIGGEAARSSQPPQSHSSPSSASASVPPPNNHAMQPPSPRRGVSSGPRSDYPPYRRHPSPERSHYPSTAPRAMDSHAYSANSSPRSYSNQGSPEQPRQGLPQASQPYKPMIFSGPRAYDSPASDPHPRDARQTGHGMPPRPSSQPTGPPVPPAPEQKSGYDTLSGRRPYGQSPEERRRTLGDSHHTRPSAAELLGGISQPTSERDRPVTVQPVAPSAFSPPRDQRSYHGSQQPSRAGWRQQLPDDHARETGEGRREEPSGLFRSHYSSYPPSSQTAASFGSSTSEETVRRRSSDHLMHRVVEQYHAPPTSDPSSNDRRRAEQLAQSMGPTYHGRPSPFDQSRRMGEEMQASKSFLGLDANRRTGRASPLPQAVQGAQAQPVSIGKDPNIKSEFGRMFSGLGGLGGGLPGSTTPSRQSPLPQGSAEQLPPGVDINDLRMQRVSSMSSQNGRKSKRVKDEEGILDSESADGRGTPSLLGARGSKRTKHTHPVHHHHHHAHTHHHHHHHHKPEEELANSAPNGSSSATAPNNTRYASVPQNGATPQHPHHHHHYHAAPHHHHLPPRTNQAAPLPSPKISPKVHEIQSVLDEAAKRQRRHLGSQLYDAALELPKANSQLDDQFGYASKPKPLPKFDTNPINCTFTVRVPRHYMKPKQRQQIVLQRHLWGACIYRADSDPIAAAIHSGWLRGEWDETVNVNMLDPRITAPNEPGDAEDTLTKVPAAPVTPPADMDLHITLLILPTTDEYYSSCEYGMTSRGSRSHDKLSFKIHKLQWVDEGYGTRGQERGAAALKRRLDAGKTLLSLMSGDGSFGKTMNGTAKLPAVA